MAHSDKNRFATEEFDEDGETEMYVRANQGHSFSVPLLQLSPCTPQELPLCLHGTYKRHLDSILSQGLLRMSRNHVHLIDANVFVEYAVISGMRGSCDMIVYVDSASAMNDGIKFGKSANGVVLTEGVNGAVPPKYITKVTDRRGNVLFDGKSKVF